MDLSYFNARIRGLRGRLLEDEQYAALIESRSADEYLDSMRSTSYGPYVERAQARFERFDDIASAAIRQNLLDAVATVQKTAPEEAMPLLKSVLSQWEVFNLKAIIRGIAKGAKREDIRAGLVPLGEFDMAALNMLLGSRGVEDLVRFLDTWGSPYAEPVRAGWKEFERAGQLLPLELGLDIFSYSFALSMLAGRRGFDCETIRELTAMRIDAANIVTLLKIAGEGFSREGAGEFFIEGGRSVTRELFLECSALKTRDEVGDLLSEEVKDPLFSKALGKADFKELAALEELLYDSIQKRLERAAVTRPLSIALSSAFLYKKVREARNLRVIARSKIFGVPSDELQKFLFY